MSDARKRMHEEKGVAPFSADIVAGAGYVYADPEKLSCRVANERLTRVSLEIGRFRDCRVIDLGCGDGTYSATLFREGGVKTLLGIDPSEEAVALASRRFGSESLTFESGSAYSLRFADDTFDVAYLRGVLHHMDRPEEAVREALRVAREVVIIEPNGLSPVLKVIERVSRYHREHHERSYPAGHIRRWIDQAGGEVAEGRWVGLVPMFCPDFLVGILKAIEPIFERLPVLRQASCAVYCVRAVRLAKVGKDGD